MKFEAVGFSTDVKRADTGQVVGKTISVPDPTDPDAWHVAAYDADGRFLGKEEVKGTPTVRDTLEVFSRQFNISRTP